MPATGTAELDGLPLHAVLSNRYRIEALLGRGGAALVYRARDNQNGRRIALKQLQLRGGVHDALLTSFFEREYHTLCQLAHPCIIAVYDYGVDGSPYYTMELLDGEDLRERGALPYHEVCGLLCDVASSLSIVHSRGRVHRDVSPRNVRCTRDGHAKLIDFGAMAPIGIAQPLVGTPPFVPPEAVALQALDGRVDLYALGALLYFLLTRRHAYPAQTFTQLRDLWRTAPATPRQYDPTIPAALDQLVMQLLQLERAARPRSAAEVMERLAGIAGRPLHELREVSRAYLTAPVLVGRGDAIKEVRGRMVNAMRGRGGSTLIEGAPGLGRSRMLDACVLEAKLLGAVVLRAGAAPLAHGPEHALVRVLCAQLLAASPVLAEQAARPRRTLLAHVIPTLAQEAMEHAPAPARRQLHAALRHFFLTVTRDQYVVIAVDDVERADEGSVALLGMLAHGAARRKLSLLLTSETRSDASPGMLLLQHAAQRVLLSPLQASETAALLRSLFDDVEHLDHLASRIHALAEGNPRRVMALCERLVERNVARYHAGRWTLPAELGPEAVPESLAREFAARIDALSDDARTLGELLSVTDPALFSLPDYTALNQQPDHGRTYRALEELVSASILIHPGERYQFSQPEFARTLRDGIDLERIPALHARIAEVLAGREQAAQYAEHLLLSGQARAAMDAAMSAVTACHTKWDPRTGESLMRTLDAALQVAGGELPPWVKTGATHAVLGLAVILGDVERFARCRTVVLDRLSLDSGLTDYATMTELGGDRRMSEALERAAQRYDATPVPQRGFMPSEAITRLVWLVRSAMGMAAVASDASLLDCVPDFAALSPLSPLVALTEQERQLARALIQGRWQHARVLRAALHKRLAAHDRAGVDDLTAQNARIYLLYGEGVLLAASGADVPPDLLARLEQSPGFRTHAWRVRMLSELMRCNFDAARASERRAELIHLQDGGGAMPGNTVRAELTCYSMADDLRGVQSARSRIEELARRFPGWRAAHAIACSHVARLQGDAQAALDALQPALESTRAGCDVDWVETVRAHIHALLLLGRTREAVEVGVNALAVPSDLVVELTPALRASVAAAQLQAGDIDAARAGVDATIATLLDQGCRGLQLGLAFEVRARVAIASKDGPALLHAADRCAQEFKVNETAVLNARYERILREAHATGLPLPSSVQYLSAQAAPDGRELSKTLYSRMLTCIGPTERAREVLNLLIEESHAHSGYLFGLRGGRLQLMAHVDDPGAPEDLKDLIAQYLDTELDAQDLHRRVVAGNHVALQSWIDAWGREFEPLLLCGQHDGEMAIAAVVALHCQTIDPFHLSGGVLLAAAEALLAVDIVDPITCVG